MMRTAPTLMAVLLLVFGGGRAASQEPPCFRPQFTVEAFKEHLLERGRAEDWMAVSGLVGSALEPPAPPACRVRLPQDADLQAVMEDLVRFVADQGVPALNRGFFMAIGRMIRVDDEGEEQRELPMDAMAYAVEEGRTEQGRGHALYTLWQLADAPQVTAYLLSRARAPRGPPAWPELPWEIVRRVYFGPSERDAALRAALESDLSRIRNPRARCVVEHRGRLDGPPGGLPRCPGG